jgi:hypothetical protein
MARVPFMPLPAAAFVFRLAEIGKRFLPEDAVLPLSDFFIPSSEDRRQAGDRGRSAGVSVWDLALTTVVQAESIRFNPDTPSGAVRAFGLHVGTARDIGRACGKEIDVVADPLPGERGPGAEGHSLIEGLERKGGPRPEYRRMLDRLVSACEEVR